MALEPTPIDYSKSPLLDDGGAVFHAVLNGKEVTMRVNRWEPDEKKFVLEIWDGPGFSMFRFVKRMAIKTDIDVTKDSNFEFDKDENPDMPEFSWWCWCPPKKV